MSKLPGKGPSMGKKEEKAAKETNKMFKSMISAASGGALGGLGLFMEALSPLMDIFKLLEPILKVVGGLFKAMIGEVLKELMPYIMDFAKFLMKLMPVFKLIGKAIGKFVAWFLGEGGILTVLQSLWDILVDIGKFIGDIFMGIWEAIVWYFNLIFTVYSNTFGLIFDLIVDAFWFVYDAVVLIFNTIAGVINAVIGILNDLDVLNVIPDIPTIPMLKSGGVMDKTGLAYLHEGEEVLPAGESVSNQEILWALEDIERNTRQESSRWI